MTKLPDGKEWLLRIIEAESAPYPELPEVQVLTDGFQKPVDFDGYRAVLGFTSGSVLFWQNIDIWAWDVCAATPYDIAGMISSSVANAIHVLSERFAASVIQMADSSPKQGVGA